MLVRDLENIIGYRQIIDLKINERIKTKYYSEKRTTEYKTYFGEVIKLYELFDVDKITTNFEGDILIIISN